MHVGINGQRLFHHVSHLYVIHPIASIHPVPVPVVLCSLSPALSITPLAFIFHHSNVRVIPSAITHVHFAHAESLVRLLALTVIQHAPTKRLVAQHVSFPSLSIIAQIQHLLLLHPLQILIIHSQQLLSLHIRHHHIPVLVPLKHSLLFLAQSTTHLNLLSIQLQIQQRRVVREHHRLLQHFLLRHLHRVVLQLERAFHPLGCHDGGSFQIDFPLFDEIAAFLEASVRLADEGMLRLSSFDGRTSSNDAIDATFFSKQVVVKLRRVASQSPVVK